MAHTSVCALLGAVVLLATPLPAATPTPDGVEQLLARLEQAVRSGSPGAYAPLLSAYADRPLAAAFAASVIQPGTTRAVIRERDRSPLQGTLPGEGFELTVEAFVESCREARLYTWSLDVKRVGRRGQGVEEGTWLVAGQRVLGTLPAIHRLQLDERKQFTGRQIVITDEDLEITMSEADVFVAEASGSPTAVVVLGRGQMRFAPAQLAERGQVKLFSGSETLVTAVDSVFMRVPPGESGRHIKGSLEPRQVDTRQFLKAHDIFRAEAGRSFGLDLVDLSPDAWSLLPMPGDFLAEVQTRKLGTLTYARASRDAEDISFFDRTRRRNIASYASAARLAARGRFYNDDDAADYKVRSYDIDTTFEPGRQWLEGRTQLRLEIVAPAVSTLTLRLADSLAVSSVTAREYGRLLAVRVRGQNSLVVALPVPVARGLGMTLDVVYAGVAAPQAVDQEGVDLLSRQDGPEEMRLEASFLYSNQTFWYAQAPGNTYSTATLRMRVPHDYSCVASGQLVEASTLDTRAKAAEPLRLFTFVARRPARYFACLITPLVQGASRILRMGRPGAPDEAGSDVSLKLEVKANPRLQRMAKPLADSASEILEFYGSIMGDTPYPDATVAAVEWKVPGGHSPAYMAVLNQPIPGTSTQPYRNDPAFFDGFPEFYLAHELAHQWWGQAVGWKNYHEQWLSEGLSQYFAALYAGRARGAVTFESVMRRFRQTSMDAAGEGPIYLGYRVGHLKGDSRLFRSVVYNKSGVVLHMLRRMTGDEAFFAGLRRFYSTWRFQKAGSDDLRVAMQGASGLVLDRFFERWIYGDGLPEVSYSTSVADTPTGPEAVVRFEQSGDIYDLPVTVTVECAGQPPIDMLVKITDRQAEAHIPLTGALKKVEVNRDNGALGRFTAAKATLQPAFCIDRAEPRPAPHAIAIPASISRTTDAVCDVNTCTGSLTSQYVRQVPSERSPAPSPASAPVSRGRVG
jgi:hypothetical protein